MRFQVVQVVRIRVVAVGIRILAGAVAASKRLREVVGHEQAVAEVARRFVRMLAVALVEVHLAAEDIHPFVAKQNTRNSVAQKRPLVLDSER